VKWKQNREEKKSVILSWTVRGKERERE